MTPLPRFGGLQVQGCGSLERLAGYRGRRRCGALVPSDEGNIFGEKNGLNMVESHIYIYIYSLPFKFIM